MADENKAGPFATIEAKADTKSPTAKKRRSPRLQKAAAEQVRDFKGTAAKPKRYSDQEKNDKLKQSRRKSPNARAPSRTPSRTPAYRSRPIINGNGQQSPLIKRTTKLVRPEMSWQISFNSRRKTRGFVGSWPTSCVRRMLSCVSGSGWTETTWEVRWERHFAHWRGRTRKNTQAAAWRMR